ncbi:MAG: ribosome-associated translation inhibitor RaiA [Myxococcales bacterium]|nr:MAG: ribosome-associated translation inhibitor RaiA [Myxococcales bacterium]
MTFPLQITFRDIPPSEALEQRIREKAAKLEKFHDRIHRCHVVIEAPHRHKHKGFLYEVTIDITLPICELLANQRSGTSPAHEDAYVAVRDAFDAAARRLEDYIEKKRTLERQS